MLGKKGVGDRKAVRLTWFVSQQFVFESAGVVEWAVVCFQKHRGGGGGVEQVHVVERVRVGFQWVQAVEKAPAVF